MGADFRGYGVAAAKTCHPGGSAARTPPASGHGWLYSDSGWQVLGNVTASTKETIPTACNFCDALCVLVYTASVFGRNATDEGVMQ